MLTVLYLVDVLAYYCEYISVHIYLIYFIWHVWPSLKGNQFSMPPMVLLCIYSSLLWITTVFNKLYSASVCFTVLTVLWLLLLHCYAFTPLTLRAMLNSTEVNWKEYLNFTASYHAAQHSHVTQFSNDIQMRASKHFMALLQSHVWQFFGAIKLI